MTDLIEKNLKGTELWREYEFGTSADRFTYRILAPVTLWYHEGGTTHRVLDSEGVTHCVPAPGQNLCILRWIGETEF